ncbi:condensin subunit ScpA [Tistlia consotensis]|uniref:Segregation and condensation protein A n=1 Tax=Tistlia consotensis USBA 355 TaxID=560819 RepID=A0A1Y6BJK1_9PROT|nr:ScpA family protein [Tistlia consotensis]SMF14196.1 condensin subunit ScpA [Tistlia consotensis USBA 355]SNR49713.1 condensin subunit ScpA [Tistlia consotensis]
MSGADFAEDSGAPTPLVERLVVDVEGFEGPLDLLLELARDQKVDITKISILALAEQYLAFVQEARRVRLELAADYLVMAAWLAYLKSRLLLPAPEPDGEEPTGEELAAALRFQLQRLQALRDAGGKLVALPQLGRDTFARGEPEKVRAVETVVYEATLFDLLKAYGRMQRKAGGHNLRIARVDLYSVEEAVKRLSQMLGEMPSWRALVAFLPPALATGDPLAARSAVASTFVASLELCKRGLLDLRQDRTFAPIYLRSRPEGERDLGEFDGAEPPGQEGGAEEGA